MKRRIERVSMRDLIGVGLARCERPDEFNPGPARARFDVAADEAETGVECLLGGTLVLDPEHPITVALADLRTAIIETRRENGICPWCGLDLPIKTCYDEEGRRLSPDVADCLPCDECAMPPEDE